jgi:hypothetical protein
MTKLETAIANGKALGKQALYYGCWKRPGHFLHKPNGVTIFHPQRDVPGFGWTDDLLDTGLLKNGNHPDVNDGKVFWTCGGLSFWYAFFWWDKSVDHRGGANSGFYSRGFGWPEANAAFDYACTEFPPIVARQNHPLILQTLTKGKQT